MTRTVHVEVLTTTGRATGVDFVISPTAIEVRRARACVARVETWKVRQLLHTPGAALRSGDLAIELDGSLDRERPRVAVTLPDVNGWSLSPHEHAAFCAAVHSA